MSRRKPPGKPDPQQAVKPVKLTLQLSPELAKRFGVHAEMTGVSKSELFAELVRAGCKRFVVSDRQGEQAAEEAA
jgi:hypothetical protein